ncbi:tRNA1Val (adenine37-N6)-methyltransferase [Chryseolinea serpens]|uniref:tRNA1(Val) (adenine(37)-N6)-methyltransferase n=1 Tax=Chryseolinea serpens TaxID=947013 RepID=A0A1M5VDJ4_9BACT|nr:methyltransferase [Chryseolinea serpens]SHH73317.1 tRNA1Val (adenine37-N6)-methyltransferase [Chryseolinea serpens]
MKRKTHFQFKQFEVQHDRSTMKVGTDAVLLGAWAHVANATRILDIGTGSGIIALMAAQRTPSTTQIDAVEIEGQDAAQAAENFLASPWSERLHIHVAPIQDYPPSPPFHPYLYDVILSNPPFFINSQEPPNKRRHEARHTVTLDHASLLAAADRLLQPQGTLNVVLPYTEGLQFIDLAKQHGFFCTRQYSFRTREGKPIERWLLEFSRKERATETGEILLYKEKLEWSDSYVELTRDFYLKL